MRSVLVIVTKEHLQNDIRRTLARNGLRVTTVSNGQEGLQLLGKASFDLVITDMLAEARNGIEVAKEIAVEFPTQPIVAVSGSSLADSGAYQKLVTQLGVNSFLHCPFTSRALAEAVRHVLQGSPGNPVRPGRRAAIGSAA